MPCVAVSLAGVGVLWVVDEISMSVWGHGPEEGFSFGGFGDEGLSFQSFEVLRFQVPRAGT